MAEKPDWSDWRQLLETGMQFTAMTRAEAQRRAQELVREGQLAQEKMQSFVDDLVQTSRKRADDLVDVVRKEVQRQLEALGIVRGKPAGNSANKVSKQQGKKAANKKAAKKKAAKKKATKKKAAATTNSVKGGSKKASAKNSSGAPTPSGST
jgi:polyhydroxyalkanoate synthesis regulator phasin